MTVAESIVNKIIEKKQAISQLQDDLIDLESNLVGMEVEYRGNYGCVEQVDAMDSTIVLYVEDEEGCSWNEMISIYELVELI